MSLKFIVMSDIHLSCETDGPIDAVARARAAMASVATDHADAAFIVLAGDLVDTGSVEEYALLKDVTDAAPLPVHFVLGNHDDRPAFLEVFGAGAACDTGHVQSLLRQDGHAVILLDSHEPGRLGGALYGERLNWLDRALAEVADMPVIVIVHHPPYRLMSTVDRIGLDDAGPLMARLAAHGQVRQVISGHIHRTSSAIVGGIACATLSGNVACSSLTMTSVQRPLHQLDGPGQYAIVVSDDTQTLLHFHDFETAQRELPSE